LPELPTNPENTNDMSREIRRVPATWEHPKNERGHHTPLLASFGYNAEEIAEGLRDGWLENTPPHYGCPVMPEWPEEEKTHIQMYETTSEGTPISPVMDTPENLARWLADNGASSFGSCTATYEQWLDTCRRGWAPGGFLRGGVITSGVEELSSANVAVSHAPETSRPPQP
jgi:hypothetical protein